MIDPYAKRHRPENEAFNNSAWRIRGRQSDSFNDEPDRECKFSRKIRNNKTRTHHRSRLRENPHGDCTQDEHEERPSGDPGCLLLGTIMSKRHDCSCELSWVILVGGKE